MTSLVNAELGTVTAAADLQLRTTEWGLRSLDDLEWAMPKVVLTELQSNYRQSQQLLELSDLLSGASQNRFSVSRFDSKGLKPTLGQKCGSLTETAKWLSERVSEIVHRAGRLPSTGVAVLKPSEVAPLTEALSRVLASQDLKARAFTPGQPLGFSNDIRVLTLDEARGLEFEAFFLVSQEDLSRSQPDLYNRLLYLASSRAITYLGFIFRETLPSNLDNLTRLTVPDWSQPHETFATLSL
jgi:DNA helicase IV